MWRIGILLLIASFFLLGFAWMERNLAVGASTTPEEISLKDLIARGPEGNPNIILKDYELGDNYVYDKEKYSKSWKKVWVPVMAVTDPEHADPPGRHAAVKNVQAILVSTRVKNESELVDRLDQERLPGMVTNRIDSLGYQEKELLSKSYPNANLDKCLIIEEGREPAGSGKLVALGGGGILSLLGGIGFLALSFVRRKSVPSYEGDRPERHRRLDEDEDDEPRSKRRRPRDEDDE